MSDANRLSSKFFFSNQPSRDPFADSAALTLHEREETTYQRTLSVTDVHVFRSGMVNEVRAGFFRNRNDSMAVRYFTNAEFGIQNPFAEQVPDLTQITIGGDDVGGELRFGTPGDGTRIFDRQTTWTVGNTLSLVRGSHSMRVGGECAGICSTAICRRRAIAATTSTRGSTSSRWLCESRRPQPRTADFRYRAERRFDSSELSDDRLELVRSPTTGR